MSTLNQCKPHCSGIFVCNNSPCVTGIVKKYGWVFGAVMLLWLASSYGAYQANKSAFERIYRATIDGKIQSLQTQNHGFSIALELDNHQRYRFFPQKQQGGAAGFLATAAVGDSIRKRSLSDTLLVIKKGQVVRYVFEQVLN